MCTLTEPLTEGLLVAGTSATKAASTTAEQDSQLTQQPSSDDFEHVAPASTQEPSQHSSEAEDARASAGTPQHTTSQPPSHAETAQDMTAKFNGTRSARMSDSVPSVDTEAEALALSPLELQDHPVTLHQEASTQGAQSHSQPEPHLQRLSSAQTAPRVQSQSQAHHSSGEATTTPEPAAVSEPFGELNSQPSGHLQLPTQPTHSQLADDTSAETSAQPQSESPSLSASDAQQGVLGHLPAGARDSFSPEDVTDMPEGAAWSEPSHESYTQPSAQPQLSDEPASRSSTQTQPMNISATGSPAQLQSPSSDGGVTSQPHHVDQADAQGSADARDAAGLPAPQAEATVGEQ